MERRTFLVLGAASVGLAGCTADPAPPVEPSVTPVPARDPDADLRARVAASEAALVGTYREALAAAPALADRIGRFADHHMAHLVRVAPDVDAEALVAAAATGPPTAAASGTDQGQPSATDSGGQAPRESGAGTDPGESGAGPTPGSSPVDVAALLARLAEAEGQAHADRLTACDGATGTALARDLCLIAASEAQHERVLVGGPERAS